MVRGEAALTRRKAPRRKKILAAFFCFNAASLSIRKKSSGTQGRPCWVNLKMFHLSIRAAKFAVTFL